MSFAHADIAANVSEEVSNAVQQPRGTTSIHVQANDTLFVAAGTLQEGAAALKYTARNSVVREIQRHHGNVNATLPTNADKPVSPTLPGTRKLNSRNGMVRVSTAAPTSYVSTVLANGDVASAEAHSRMGMIREGGALMCLAVLVLWLTRNSLRAMCEEVMDPNQQSRKWEASLEPGKTKPKQKALTAYDFGTSNDVSESFTKDTDCFQQRLDQVMQTHRIQVPSSSPQNCEPTL